MILKYCKFIPLILLPIMSSSQKKDSAKLSYKKITITTYSEEPDPPFKQGQISNFVTIADWLKDLCNSQKPEKEIDTYEFYLFEEPNNYVLCVVGLNSYPWKDSNATKIDFRPTNMYLKLSPKEYSGLNQRDIREKIYLQLKEFTNTEEFKKSFLSKANLITAAFGEDIWSKSH